MVSKAWKNTERSLAKLFGTTRNPLSGRNSKHSASDSLHPRLFLESKRHKLLAVWSLFSATKILAQKEKKIPVLGLRQNGKRGMLLVIHSEDMERVAIEYLEANGYYVNLSDEDS